MSFTTQQVTSVHHWTDRLFSFTTTRAPNFKFENGQFTMLTLPKNQKIKRAYSMVSANYEEHLEFLSIKVPGGQFTEPLQNLQIGDEILVSDKSVGTLTVDHVIPGKNLYLLSTGTGIAPFLSVIRDLNIYDKFENVILVHSVRNKQELVYSRQLIYEFPKYDLIGDNYQQQLILYPIVTGDNSYKRNDRITSILPVINQYVNIFGISNKYQISLSQLSPQNDRFMVCGNPEMVKQCMQILNDLDFKQTRKQLAQYTVEQAFVEK